MNTPADRSPTTADFRFATVVDIAAARDGESATARRITGTAYSGNVLRHPFWGRVVFDLSSTSAPDALPVLVEHDRAKRAGVAKLSITDGAIEITDGRLLDNVTGREVAADADAGFPWQLSVHIDPARVDTVNEGETVTVNGHQVEGPANVFRQSSIREVSFTPTGVDPNTSATVFSTGSALDHANEANDMPDPSTSGAPAAELQSALTAATAELDGLRASLETANQEIAQLRQAQADTARAAREAAIRDLFSVTGREYSDESAAPYFAMDAAAFAAVDRDLRQLRSSLPDALFTAQATDGAASTATEPTQFAAAIRAEQARAEQAGDPIDVLEAARRARAAATP